MGLVLTEQAKWPSILVPVATEPVSAESGAGGIRPMEQALTNRTAYLLVPGLQQLELSLIPHVHLSVTPDQALCYPLQVVALWKDDAQSELVLASMPAAVTTGAPAMAGLNYLYLWWNAGTLELEASTSPPINTSTLNYQTGHPTRRCVGCAYAYDPGGGAPLAWRGLRQLRGHAVLDAEIELQAWAAGTSAPIAVSAVGKIPEGVRLVDVEALVNVDATATAVTGGGYTLQVWRHGAIGATQVAALTGSVPVGESAWGTGNIVVALNDSRQLDWKLAAPAVGNVARARLAITGWYL